MCPKAICLLTELERRQLSQQGQFGWNRTYQLIPPYHYPFGERLHQRKAGTRVHCIAPHNTYTKKAVSYVSTSPIRMGLHLSTGCHLQSTQYEPNHEMSFSSTTIESNITYLDQDFVHAHLHCTLRLPIHRWNFPKANLYCYSMAMYRGRTVSLYSAPTRCLHLSPC